MKNKRIIIYAFLTIAILLNSCTTSKIERAIKEIHLATISIPQNELVTIIDNATNCSQLPFRLLVHISKEACTECTLDHLPDWGYILKEMNQEQTNVQIILIWDTPKLDNATKERLSSHNFPMTIYWDSASVFTKKNPIVNQYAAFHSLLLNEDNKVIVVGNPTQNKKVQELMYNIVSHK